MIKSDANNNKEELETVKEESEKEVKENDPNSFSYDLFSLKTLLPPLIPPKGKTNSFKISFSLKTTSSNIF